MRHAARLFALAPFFFTVAARAIDTFQYDDIRYTGTILGLRDGRLWANVGGAERLYDLAKVQFIQLAAIPPFSEGELVRATDPKKAAALYKEAIRTTNAASMKQLAQFRAIEVADIDGKWTEAVVYFLEVYQAQPNDIVWRGRPTRLPDAPSSMLKESADKIAAVLRTIKPEDAKKNLRSFQLDILSKAGDSEAAQRLAREISTGIVEDPRGPVPVDAAAQAAAAIADVENHLRNKNYDAALARADALLDSITTTDSASATLAVPMFALKARVFEEQKALDLATAVLLRIPSHYPGSDRAPAALLQAAELQKRANHPAAAAQLYHEIIANYPDSKEAPLAKQAGGK